MKKPLIIYILITFFAPTIFAQKIILIDSLINRLNSATDTSEVNTLIKIADQYSGLGELDKKTDYLQKAMQKAELINYTDGLIRSLNLFGDLTLWKGNSAQALTYHLKSLALSEKINDLKAIANSLLYISYDHNFQGNYLQSVGYCLKALKIYEKINYNPGIADAYNNIGNNYSLMNNYPTALSNYLNALKIREDIGDKQVIAWSLRNIGKVYYSLHDYNSSLEYYAKSLAISELVGDKLARAIVLNKIGDIYRKKKEFSKGIENYSKALEIMEELGDKHDYAGVFLNIGIIYKEQKDYEKAKMFFFKSLGAAIETTSKFDRKQAYYQLSDLYLQQADYQHAFRYLTLFSELKDSLLNETSSKQIAEMQTKYDTEKKQHEIDQLKTEQEIQQFQSSRKQYVIYGLTGLFGLIVTIGALVLKGNKTKSRQQTIELEQKLLRSQMNPHFIYNSLNAIQNFILKNKVMESTTYISNFAKLMRLILENSRKEYVSIRKELDTLELYLNLQQLRFANEFEYYIDIDPEIDVEEMSIPPMLAQPFIENAIEHGIRQNKTAGKINVSFNIKDQFITFEVEDNGIGRENAQLLKQGKSFTHKSLALEITRERVSIFNKQNSGKIKFEIIDLKNELGDASGTKVIFNIPFKNFEI